MAFYDSFPKCSKCCFFVNLRHGAIVLGVLSLLIRIVLFTLMKYYWVQNAFREHYDAVFEAIDMTLASLEVVFSIVLGTVADVLLLLGAFLKVQKYVRVYLPIMCVVFVFEILLFAAFFLLGFHWLDAIDVILFGGFHVWCWFTAHSLNQQWNTFVPSSGNKPEDFETLPSNN